MHNATFTRLFDPRGAFEHPVTVLITAIVLGLIIGTPILLEVLRRGGKIGSKQTRELYQRYYSWLILAPVMIIPVLLGGVWTILAVGVLGILCFREYAVAVDLWSERSVVYTCLSGIVCLTLTQLDHWYRLFVALVPLTIGMIAIVALIPDQPRGYLRRVSLGILGFMLFGSCLGHLGYFANEPNYRPMILLILFCVEMNDIFGYCCGKLFGRYKLAPRTSPKKTLAGSLGALVLSTLLVMGLGSQVYANTALSSPLHLLNLGIIISLVGQFGDLIFSSIKRDLGIKDLGSLIPGHGGLLDRFDSVILVAPAVFHYVNYFQGIGADQQIHIFSGQA